MPVRWWLNAPLGERRSDGVRLYFGEFDENQREASPGLLDRLSPQARNSSFIARSVAKT
jgi:hypothetical protein